MHPILSEKKVKLCLVGRNVEKLRAIKEKLLKFSPKIEICPADLKNEDDIKSISCFVEKEFGALDILIHSAGVIAFDKIETASLDNLDWQFQINYRAPYLITQSLLPTLKETQGQIVFINSSAIQRAIPNLVQYSSSKFALKGLADSLREEINPYGIRVLSIYPGQTASAMQKKLYKEKSTTYRPDHLLQPEDISDVVIHSLMLPRTAEITELFIRPMLKAKTFNKKNDSAPKLREL